MSYATLMALIALATLAGANVGVLVPYLALDDHTR